MAQCATDVIVSNIELIKGCLNEAGHCWELGDNAGFLYALKKIEQTTWLLAILGTTFIEPMETIA